MRESGRIPRTLECELTSDLVDSCVPGDIAVVAGEVKVTSVDEGSSKGKKKEQTMFLLYLSVNSVTGPRTKIVEEAVDDAVSLESTGTDRPSPSLLLALSTTHSVARGAQEKKPTTRWSLP